MFTTDFGFDMFTAKCHGVSVTPVNAEDQVTLHLRVLSSVVKASA